MSLEDCRQEQSQKQNLDMHRERSKRRFFGLVTMTERFRGPIDRRPSARQSLTSSVSSASSAFPGFVFGFWHIATLYNLAFTFSSADLISWQESLAGWPL